MAGIQIPIEVVDKFSKQLKDLDSKMGNLTDAAKKQNTAFNILAADVVVKYSRDAASAIIDFGRDCMKSFGESEEASARLKISMQNLGVYTDAAFDRQLRLSEALQKTTTYSDEQVTGIQTQLTSFGLYGKELERVTKLTLDLAAGQKMDASQAAMLLGKAFVGQTGALSRLGITFDETGTRAQKFDSITAGLQKRYGGSAAAELETYNGQVRALANAWDQVKEKIGGDLIGTVKGTHGPLLQLVEDVDKNYESIKRFSIFIAKASMGPVGAIKAAIDDYKNLGKAQDEALAKGTAAFKRDQAMGPDKPGKPAAAVDNEAVAAQAKLQAEQDLLEKSAQQKLDSYIFTSAELRQMEQDDNLAEIEAQFGKDAARLAQAQITADAEKQIKITAARAGMNALDNLATLQNAKNKELAAVGKAAAISRATIQTYLGATEAYAAMASIPFVGPALGYAAAAAAIVAGMAQVAMISGTPLAEGGLVKARSGGMNAVIGEGGRDEAVIPLDDPRTQQRLAGAFGGGKSVNVNVGGINITVQGEGSNLRSLAAKLAEEVRAETVDAITLALRLNNLSSLNSGLAA